MTKLELLTLRIANKNAKQVTLKEKLSLAIQVNKDYITLVSPTNAQTNAQVKKLTRQNNQIIRLLLSLADEVD